jgi:hypothetical protein
MRSMKKSTKKQNFLDTEGISRNSKILYALTPYENVDKNKKLVYKCGMSYAGFANRLEQYYTSFPGDLIVLQVLVLPKSFSKKELKDAESLLFKMMIAKAGSTEPAKRIHNTTRVRKANAEGLGQTEWLYGSEERLEEVFVALYEKYSEVHLKSFDLEKMEKPEAGKGKSYEGRTNVDLDFL